MLYSKHETQLSAKLKYNNKPDSKKYNICDPCDVVKCPPFVPPDINGEWLFQKNYVMGQNGCPSPVPDFKVCFSQQDFFVTMKKYNSCDCTNSQYTGIWAPTLDTDGQLIAWTLNVTKDNIKISLVITKYDDCCQATQMLATTLGDAIMKSCVNRVQCQTMTPVYRPSKPSPCTCPCIPSDPCACKPSKPSKPSPCYCPCIPSDPCACKPSKPSKSSSCSCASKTSKPSKYCRGSCDWCLDCASEKN